MAKLLLLLLLMTGSIAFAQKRIQPTQFDKFVHKSGIEWAAYASDSFCFSEANFNKLLIKKLSENKIKASLPIYSRTSEVNDISYLSKAEIDSKILTEDNQNKPNFDDNGDIHFAGFNKNKKADSSVFHITEIEQILYVEKGKLKSYILWVTPTLPLFTQSGSYIGESFYFNSAYNFKYNKKSRKLSKLLFLSQTSKMISLNTNESGHLLKEMYGRNLVETLWPHILKNQIDLFFIASNQKLHFDELKSPVVTDYVSIPIYDSINRILRFETVPSLQKPVFTSIQLVQDWYYDAKRNKVTNTIKEAYIYVKPWSINGEAKEAAPVLKLVFK